jgi:hypothetical protein
MAMTAAALARNVRRAGAGREVHLWLFALGCLGCMLASCTKDFSRFRFEPSDAGTASMQRDGADMAGTAAAGGGKAGAMQSSGQAGAGSGGRAPSDPGFGRGIGGRSGAGAGMLAAGVGGHAGTGSGGRLAGGAGGRAAGGVGGHAGAGAGTSGSHQPAADGGVVDEDAGHVDAGSMTPHDTLLCLEPNADLDQLPPTCRNCACDACAEPFLGCLADSDNDGNPVCADLLRCALLNGCHDMDCYCRSSSFACFTNSSVVGDGPCVDEMNEAAGGTKDHASVRAAHTANDQQSPLVRAVLAIGCSSGEPTGALGGAKPGMCADECMPN